jgi:hypothetical protein
MDREQKSINRLREAGRRIAEGTRQASLSNARELADLFTRSGFFQAFAYDSPDIDGRLEQRTAQGHADILLRSFTGRLVALLQVEPPGTQIAETFQELADHAQGLLGRLPDTLALTNGTELWVCPSVGGHLQKTHLEFNLSELNEGQAQILYRFLNRAPVDWGRDVRGSHL